MSRIYFITLFMFVFITANLWAAEKDSSSAKVSSSEVALKPDHEKNSDTQETRDKLALCFNDLNAKAMKSLEFETSLFLLDFKVIKPFDRKLASNDAPIFEFDFPASFLGFGYTKNGDSSNFDSAYINLLFIKIGKNFGGKKGGISNYGKWNKNTSKPAKFFFCVPEIEFSNGNFSFYKKNSLLAGYNGAVSVGIKHHWSKKSWVSWKYNFDSNYLDAIKDASNNSFRNSFAMGICF
ncbi:MAG: hypothetical protein PHW04_15330 [Candidatus Wallbacteria bacterium]|nr:hypothetical protein [Candidatus Wallbacteria bacterium]